MDKTLQGKHIILGITGGIAAYKSASLLRLFVKAGAEVQVVMTSSAKEFITPVTLSALSGKPVVSEFFTANTGEWHSHVDLGLWADVMVIAPATACTIGKMANGIADNMLVTTYLSAKEPVFVAPAMDLDMMAHPSTTANIAKLRSYGNHIIEPEAGELASHLIGKGRMEEPERIFEIIERFLTGNKLPDSPCSEADKAEAQKCEVTDAEAVTSGALKQDFKEPNYPSANLKQDFKGKIVLITAGPTREKIDPVRFISNYSTGKMGYAIADELASRGAHVLLVSGPVEVSATEPGVEIFPVESGKEMAAKCAELFPQSDMAVMCAAVADYTVENPSAVKIKREGNETPRLRLVKNPDIARTLGQQKRPGQLLIGFALETDHEQQNARLKLQRKNLDMIVMNSLRDPGAGFGTDTNKVTVYFVDKEEPAQLPLQSKREIATHLADFFADALTQE